MTVMTKKQEDLLDQLIAIAGEPELVEEALRSLNEESAAPPDLRAVVRRILELRQKQESMTHA